MRLFFVLLTTLYSLSPLAAQESETFYSTTLKNGMQVYLKPLKLDDASISIELAIKNGYASFNDPSSSAYALSPGVAIESDASSLFGGHDDAIDLYYSVEAFYSYWILETDMLHARKAIEGLHSLLTDPSWNEEVFQEAVQNISFVGDREEMERKDLLQMNGIPSSILSPYTQEKIKTLTLADTSRAYRNLFSDPQKMTFVISGAFRAEEMQEWIEQTFGTMPRLEKSTEITHEPSVTFPLEPREQVAPLIKNTDPLIALSFPIPYPLNQESFPLTELTAQALEESLKHDSHLGLINPSSLDISLELPLYPHLQSPWLLVQFQSSSKSFRQEAVKVASAIQERFKQGVNQEALKLAREQIDITDSFWRNEPEYWLAFLGNQALLNFSPEQSLKLRKDLLTVPLTEVNHQLALFPQNRYTTFISSGKDY